MQLPSPRDIGQLNQRLAQHNSRVADAMQSLPGLLDELIAAADRRDWREVTRHSESLAELGHKLKCDTLAQPASDLAAVAEARASEIQIKRGLLRVIAAASFTRKTSFLVERAT